MYKFAAAALAAIFSLSAAAEGYQVNTFSARQEGMGHVGVAMNLGSESLIFNPGAVAFSTDNFEISGAISAIKATADATVDGADGPQKYTTSNKVSTPMNIAASFRIYDNFYGGVAFYTPYGSSINWGQAWPGAVLNQSVDLKVFTIQPTLSWRPIKQLSVGAGIMISWGSVNLNKGLIPASSMNAMVGTLNAMAGAPVFHTYDNNLPPASVNLNGKSELAVGVNVGVMYEPIDNLTFGVSFRSKQTMKVQNGDAILEYADNQASQLLGDQLDILNSANFNASMPCPYVLTFGVAYKPVPKLLVAFDAQLNGWKTYKQLDIAFPELAETFQQHLPKNYSNAWTFHIGGEYNLTPRLDLRAGLMIDCTPCNDQYYNPETPGMTKIEPSVGLSFRPIKGLSFDLAFMYVHGCGATGSNEYKDLLLSSMTGKDVYSTFTASYKTHAIIPAIGLSYSF